MKTTLARHPSLLTGLPRPFYLALGLCLAIASFFVGRASVQDLVGHYEGAWTNVTYGSTGKAVIDIQIQGPNATLSFDMDGYVFGMVDPPLLTMPGTVQGDVIQIDNQGIGMFGDMKGAVDAASGTLAVNLTNIPGGFILKVSTLGTVGNGVIQLDYTVDFPGPTSATNPAKGVMRTVRSDPLRITRAHQDGDYLVLDWTGGKAPYTVYRSASLPGAAWSAVGTSTSGNTARVPITDGSQGYYRVAGQ